MSELAIYPGSFDPITLGHLSVLQRAARVFPKVQLLIVHNPAKQSVFSIEQRAGLAAGALAEVSAPSNIEVATLSEGLLVEHAKRQGATALIKGFRTASDIEYELPMAQVNRDLTGIETIFLASEAGFGFVSSSLVREVASLGGDVSNYVTPAVALALSERLSK